MNQRRIPLLVVGLALIMVCGFCALTVYGTYAWFRTSDANIRFFDSIDTSASLTESAAYPAKPTLIVDSDSGNITILPGEGTDIEVEMVKTGWGSNQTEAEQAAKGIQVTVQETGDTLQFTYRVPDEFGVGLYRGGQDSVDFTIHVPAETAVEITGGFGDISLTGLSQRVTVETGFGVVTAQDLQTGENSIRLVTNFGDLSVKDSQGKDIYLESANGKVTGTGLSASGALEVISTFGDVQLDGLTASTLTVTSQSGVVEVQNGQVDGKFTASNGFGDIDVQNVAAASYEVESQNGKIALDGVSGAVQVSSDFGDIEITKGVQATLDLNNQNGKISYSGSLDPTSAHHLQNNTGDITLTVPEDSAFDLSLETSLGEINSEISATLTGTSGTTSWEAKMNGGGPVITATTDNGDITLRALANSGE